MPLARDAPFLRLRRDLTTGTVRLLVLGTIHRMGPVHGYRLIKEIEACMGVPNGIKRGTVYPVLEEFEKDGILESRWGPGPSGPQRKSYQITPKGRRILTQAAAEWAAWREAVDSTLPVPELGEPTQTNGNGNGSHARATLAGRRLRMPQRS